MHVRLYASATIMSNHKWEPVYRIMTEMVPRHDGRGYKALSRADVRNVEYKCRKCGLRVGTALGTNLPHIQRRQDSSCDDVLIRSVMER